MRKLLHWLLALGMLIGSLAGPVQAMTRCCCLVELSEQERLSLPSCCELLPVTVHEPSPSTAPAVPPLAVLTTPVPPVLPLPVSAVSVATTAPASSDWRGPPQGLASLRAPPQTS